MEWAAALQEAAFGLMRRGSRERVKAKAGELEIAGGKGVIARRQGTARQGS